MTWQEDETEFLFAIVKLVCYFAIFTVHEISDLLVYTFSSE